MNIKTKGLFKVLVIALSMLFAVALALGISGAWYNTTREANGTLSMANGIVIDYSGFNQGADVWEDNVSFNLFASQNGMLPGQSVALYNTKIKANASSIDFYARAKLEYKFFTDVEGLTEVTSQIADYSAFINTPTFAQGWVDGRNGDGWFYYATGTTFNTIPSADYVDIFTENQSLTLNIDAPGFNHQGGGYQYSNEILIKRITVTLTLNALQANASAAEFNGWEINPLVQNSNSQVVEIYSNQITLGNVGGAYKLGTGEVGSLAYDTTTLGTTLKIIVAGDSQINANAFDGSGLENIYVGDADYIAGVSSYSARIYTTPATITIGVNAFSSTNLNLYLSSSCNYNIYVSSLAGVGNVYYDGVLRNDLKSPSVGAVANTTITVLANPSITTGGSGSGSVNQVSDSKGEYTYEDTDGNIWYFDLGLYEYDGLDHGSPYSSQGHWIKDNEFGTQAEIRYCEMASSNSGQTIVIPSNVSTSELTGVSVVSIDGAWDGVGRMFSDRESITSVQIPSSIRLLNNTFSGCTSLVTITIPNSVRKIAGRAFNNCTSLNSINIPNSVGAIDSCCFLGCTSLSLFTGGSETIRVISNRYLVTIEPWGENRLIAAAINGIISISIPTLVEQISEETFMNCSNFETVLIPDSVTSIRGEAFKGCTGLTTITIPNSVTSIGNYAFYGCTGLGTVTFENSATSIGLGVFSGCTSLTTVTFGNSITSIGQGAFDGCTSLTSVTIPSSVTSIGLSAFGGCTSLTSFSGGNEKYSISVDGKCLIENIENDHKLIAFAGEGLTSYVLPNSVTYINCNFRHCTDLTSITIPNSVIYVHGFYNTNLQSVTFEGGGTRESFTVATLAFGSCFSLNTVTFTGDWTGIDITIEDNAFNASPVNGNVQLPSQS